MTAPAQHSAVAAAGRGTALKWVTARPGPNHPSGLGCRLLGSRARPEGSKPLQAPHQVTCVCCKPSCRRGSCCCHHRCCRHALCAAAPSAAGRQLAAAESCGSARAQQHSSTLAVFGDLVMHASSQQTDARKQPAAVWHHVPRPTQTALHTSAAAPAGTHPQVWCDRVHTGHSCCPAAYDVQRLPAMPQAARCPWAPGRAAAAAAKFAATSRAAWHVLIKLLKQHKLR